MLDTMRNNVRNLSWVLWLVIISFVIFYIPDLVRSPGNVVARVGSESIYVDDYQRAYQSQTQYYRSLGQGDLPEDFFEQLQIGQMVLDALVRDKLILVAARDEGLEATPQEIFDHIVQYDVFRDGQGRYVGEAEYRRILRQNGIAIEDFERQAAERVMLQKFTQLVSSGVTVTGAEVLNEYQQRNEQVQFDFFLVRPASFEGAVASEVSDADVRELFDAERAEYRVPERRRVSYAVIETESIRQGTEISEDVLRADYEQRLEEFTVPAQVRARHILFRLPPDADEATIEETRQRAADVLEQVRAGADFAEMARQHSDDSTASVGGDLGWFGSGRMVEEFDAAVESLAVDETSDLVRTTFGFHIIRLEGRRPEQVRPFEEVRGQIEQRLARERADETARQQAEEVRRAVLSRQGLEQVAASFGLEVETSELFSQQEGLEEVAAPELARQAFSLGRGRVSEPIRVPQGWVVFRVDEIVDAHLPELEEVSDRVRRDLVARRAAERAEEVAERYGARLQEGEDFNMLANEAETQVLSTQTISRSGVVPELGRQPALVMAAFGLGDGETGGPVEVPEQGFALLRVNSHVQPDWSQFGAAREQLRQEMLTQRRNSVFESLLRQLRERYRVVTYDDVLQRVVG